MDYLFFFCKYIHILRLQRIFKMAMKEKISLSRDRMIEKINSFDIDEIEKTELTNILIDAAAGTNGLSKDDKLQNVSETVFALAKLDTQGVLDRTTSAKKDNELQQNILSLTEKIDKVTETLNNIKTNFSSKIDILNENLSKNDVITMSLNNDFENIKKIKRSNLEIFLDGLKNLRWYWAVSAVIITGMIVYKPDVLEFIKKIFD